jgi:hypothetical protein
MANSRVKDLTLLTSIDATLDSFLVEDDSANITKKTTLQYIKTALGLSNTNSGDQNIFANVAVSGQSTVSAGTTTDTLTFAAGSNITITTNAGTKTVTISSTAAGVSDGDKGDITVSSGGSTWTIDAGAVTYSKIQNLTNSRVLGRKAAGAGVVEELEASDILDFITTVQGSILIRTSLGWTSLAPGTAGEFLRTNGAGANPSWSTPSASVSWGGITGTLALQTDLQTALDGKVDENASITGATKTKITYDAKGLVTAGTDAAIADITGLQTALDGKTDDAIVVSTNTTAANDQLYHVVASATFTDPTPVEGKGYVVFVRNGTATVGGTGYSTAGQIIRRVFHSGAWANYVYNAGSGAASWGSITGTLSSQTDLQNELNAKITGFADPNADRIVFWDDSAGAYAALEVGSGLSISGTTLSASGGGGADGTVLSPAQITAWQNNYNPSSWASTVGVLRINSNEFHFLSGLTATSDGHTVRIFNTGTFPIGLYNQNTDSTAANRFAFDDHDVIVLPYNSVELYYDGTAQRWSLAAGWTLNSDSPYVSKYWNEAFTTNGDSHGTTANLWPSVGGSATATAAGGITGSRVGIVELATGTGASGRATFYPSANTSMAYDDGTGKSYMEFRAEFRSPAALSDATNEYFIHAGFIDSVISDSADGAFLKYTHGLNSGQWQFLTADTSSRTTGNSTVAMAVNTWYCLRVAMYPNGTAEFYIDGVSLGRNTANLPSNGRDFSFGIVLRKNAGTTSRSMLLDGAGYTVVKYRK